MFGAKIKKVVDDMSTIDTSIDGYRYIGINLSQSQLEDFLVINTMMKENTGKYIPIHCVLLTLKFLGLLPPELMCEISDNKSYYNFENVSDYEFQKRYRKFNE